MLSAAGLRRDKFDTAVIRKFQCICNIPTPEIRTVLGVALKNWCKSVASTTARAMMSQRISQDASNCHVRLGRRPTKPVSGYPSQPMPA